GRRETARVRGRPHGRNIAIVGRAKGRGRELNERMRVTRRSHELHIDHVSVADLNNGPDVPSTEIVLGKILFQHDEIELAKAHGLPPGYTVTNPPPSSPGGMPNTITIGRVRPFGPVSEPTPMYRVPMSDFPS